MATDESNLPCGITGIVLCGGEGRRVLGADKPLLDYRGRPLIEWVLGSLEPQVDHLLISANRNLDQYATYARVFADEDSAYAGPLVGIATCLKICSTEFAFVCPADTPHLAPDIVQRLYQGLQKDGAIAAVAHDGIRRHNLHLILKRTSIDSLETYLAEGHRRVHSWLDQLGTVDVDLTDRVMSFRNLNSPGDFDR